MATVDQIIGTFRTYADEPDQTFLSTSMVGNIMNIAYPEFRQKVCEFDASILAITDTYTLSSSNVIDLTAASDSGNVLAGQTATSGRRLANLLSLTLMDSVTGNPSTIFSPTAAFNSLTSGINSYYLKGTQIFFSDKMTKQVTLSYVPVRNDIIWDTATTGPPAYDGTLVPDELADFHDLIALYACKQYAVMDAAENVALVGPQGRIAERERALEKYLNNRTAAGAQYVQDVTSRELYI